MTLDSRSTTYAAFDAPVESADVEGCAPAGPRQAAVGARADADIDRAAYMDTVNRWFVAAMLGSRTRPSGRRPARG
jgi:hypothetical protein